MKRETVFYLLMVALCFLVADFFGARLYGRVLEKKAAEQALQAELEKEVRIEVPEYHHGLRPMSEIVAGWGPRRFTLKTNSLGFRDGSKREISQKTNQYRILFIGDSFTEGIGVDYEKTFVGILDQKLRSRGVEVLNAGLSSYSPIVYYKKIKHLIETVGLEFDEVILFLDVSDIHDETLYHEESNGTISREPSESELHKQPPPEKSPWKRFALKNSLAMRMIAFYREYRAQVKDPDTLKRSRRSSWTYDAEYMAEYGQEGLQTAKRYMNDLHALLKVYGIELAIAVYPWPTTIDHQDLDSVQASFWGEWATEKNVKFLNYFPVFISPERAPLETVQTYFIPGDYHWNSDGHALIADVLWREHLNKKMFAVSKAGESSA